MKGNRKLKIGMILLIVSLFCCVSLVQATVPEQISYQGMITDDMGTPLDGAYTMRFYLYDALTGGTSLWDEEQSVAVTDGIYNVQLGSVSLLDVTVFSGDAVHLEVAIYNPGTSTWEILAPRQRLISTAYAFQAENAQSLQGYGSADFAPALHEHSGEDITSGTVDETRIDPDIARDSEITWSNLSGIPSDIADGDDVGITDETDPTVDPSVKDGVSWGELSGIPAGFADGVDNDSGGDITAVTAGTGLSGGGNSGEVSLDVAVPLSLTDDIASGGIISCENTNAVGFGGFFEASGESGRGVLGRATGTYGQGVLGFAMGDFGQGVYGWATGAHGEGIRGYATGASSRGVYGYTIGTFGYGIFGEASGEYGHGVYGRATKIGDGTNYGGYFEASGTSGTGVYGKTTGNSGYGVYGDATDSGTAGYFTSTSGYGLIVENGNVGIGKTNPSEKLEVSGDIKATGDYKFSSPKTYYLNIPACAFIKDESYIDTVWAGNTFKYTIPWGSSEDCSATAPVYLPQGATVTSVTVLYYDRHTIEDVSISFGLYGRRYDSSTEELLAQLSTTSSGSNTFIQQLTDDTIDYPTISNSNCYWLEIYWDPTSWNISLRFYGARIEYTLTTIAP